VAAPDRGAQSHGLVCPFFYSCRRATTGSTRAALAAGKQQASVVKQLEQAGAGLGKVPGRRFHCAMEADGAVSVVDVWDSMEQFQKFGETLVSIMKKLGLSPASRKS